MDSLKIKFNLLEQAFFSAIESYELKTFINYLKNNIEDGLIISGVGKNWYSSLKASKTFISLGIRCDVLDPVHALHGDLGIVQKQAVILVSKSGNTRELIELVKYLKNSKYIAGLTLNKNSKLNEYCNLIICPEVKIQEMDKFDIIPSFSIIFFQMILDYIAVNIYNNILINLKNNHPEGSIGKKLN
jgi:arabinose-5-phosphate isomerase